MKKGKKDKEKECYSIVMLPCISLCGGDDPKLKV